MIPTLTEDVIQLCDHKDLIMLLLNNVKGLIVKPMMAYRATAFTNHGQIYICCLCVTNLIKAWVTDTVCPYWFPNCFYGTWRNNSNRRPRNSMFHFFRQGAAVWPRRTFLRCPVINPLNPELNLICYLLALLGAHHFLHVSRIRVKLLTLGY